ncbi:MAG: cell wall anchor protein [Muribaculaceae bacterium]|nr:cell wall anchor protein [Muribaculaceae bacterium]
MKSKIIRYISAVAIALASVCTVTPAQAGPLMVKARLDSVSVLMGRLTMLRLEVVEDAGSHGGFELLEAARQQGRPYATVCGDSVELRTSFATDTVDLGSGRIQINYAVPVQAFDSGSYRLPELLYRSGTDSVRSNQVSLRVVPVNVTAEDPIAGYASVAKPEGKSIFDSVPDWLYDYWWLIIILLLAIGFGIWMLTRPKQQGLIPARKKPAPTPYEVAMTRLKTLKSRKLWEQGMEKEYFTELTDILRVYLDKRFGINAMEMTSRQIMDMLRSNPVIKDKREYMRRILDMADFVKFAKVRPLPADNISAYDNAVSFVEETHGLGAGPSEVGDFATPIGDNNGVKPAGKDVTTIKTSEPSVPPRQKGGES